MPDPQEPEQPMPPRPRDRREGQKVKRYVVDAEKPPAPPTETLTPMSAALEVPEPLNVHVRCSW